MKARLILENGMIFEGNAFGYLKDSVGEVVFTTGDRISRGFNRSIILRTNCNYDISTNRKLRNKFRG